MNQPHPGITISVLTKYSDKDAAEIGALLPHLSDRFDGSPVPKQLLQDIIDSPYHDQLIARDEHGTIVGTASLTAVMGAAAHRKAWLDDFVVNSDLQGAGVGGKLWDAMLEWCRRHNIQQMSFTSNPRREAAHAFYLRRGAEIYETSYFKKSIDS